MNHPHSPTYSDTPTYHQPGGWGDSWRTDVLSAVDWLGNTFKLGDKVIYCIGAGRGQMMAIGTVRQIRAKDVQYRDWSQSALDDKTGQSRETVVKTRTEIEVQVLTEKTSGHWGNRERTKPAWVNPMNVTSLENIAESARS